MKSLITRIAGRLAGNHADVLSTAERQIAELLLESGHLSKDEHGNLLDENCDGFSGHNFAIESTHVETVTVFDLVEDHEVEVEIRRLETGPMVGLDASYLSQLGPKENPHSPYDPNFIINIPEDEA